MADVGHDVTRGRESRTEDRDHSNDGEGAAPAPGERTAAGPEPTAPAAPRPKRRWMAVVAGTVLLAVAAVGAVAAFGSFAHAYRPREGDVLNAARPIPGLAFDVWGKEIDRDEADRLMKTEEGRASLTPARGAVAIDEETLRLGEEAFYTETFGNEVFLCDVVGILDGPLRPINIARALARLGGRGTNNLRVELAETVTIGGREFRAGSFIDTGIDVARGAYTPMGMKTFYDRGRIRAGITCALCHSTVVPDHFEVVHGAPNADLNAGLLLALAPNTAAYFAHTGVQSLEPFVRDRDRAVPAADGSRKPLPDARALEEAVDATLINWPPGHFDSMIDLIAAPAQIPTSFTRGNHPYSFSGVFAAGPFRGLSAQNNNVHGLNSDALTNAEAIAAMHRIDAEVYLGTLLQNASNPAFRYDPASGRRPSEFLNGIDPTPGAPGVNAVVALPTYPKATLISPVSLFNSVPGRPVWEQVNAMSAWQDALVPPEPSPTGTTQERDRGRAVFEKADCVRCHSGPALSNNKVIPLPEIGTEPARAGSMKKAAIDTPPVAYAFDTPVPLPADPKVLKVPTESLDPAQIKTAYAQGDSPGGYKVPALVGLYWSAPYLHDGGVAVGPDVEGQLGMPGTLLKGVRPDPGNSLRALVDRKLRARVIEANRSSDILKDLHVAGIGHEFWVDEEAGYSPDDQSALIQYLLLFEPRRE